LVHGAMIHRSHFKSSLGTIKAIEIEEFPFGK